MSLEQVFENMQNEILLSQSDVFSASKEQTQNQSIRSGGNEMSLLSSAGVETQHQSLVHYNHLPSEASEKSEGIGITIVDTDIDDSMFSVLTGLDDHEIEAALLSCGSSSASSSESSKTLVELFDSMNDIKQIDIVVSKADEIEEIQREENVSFNCSSSVVSNVSEASTYSNDNEDRQSRKPRRVWRQYLDESSGQSYFYNKVTKETTWDCPSDLNSYS